MRQGMDQTMLTDYPLVYQESNHPNIRVIKVDGRTVSVVPFLLRTVDVEDVSFTIGIISPTATDPEHRHRGIRTRLPQELPRQHGRDGMRPLGALDPDRHLSVL